MRASQIVASGLLAVIVAALVVYLPRAEAFAGLSQIALGLLKGLIPS